MKARRVWAWPLVPLYAAGAWAKERFAAEPKRLGWPVVSVGSLSAGGAGKTPVVIALAELLKQHGWDVDVLSRGYGRDTGEDPNFAAQVVPNRVDAGRYYGDEPVLIAQRTGLPVWVSADRYFAGKSAEAFATEAPFDWEKEKLGPEPTVRGIHLLDDGFQHRRLARDFDAVLVTAEDLDDALLPAGNRRERLAALGRADAIVVRMEEREEVVPRAREWMRPEASVWVIRRGLRFPAPLGVLSAGLRPLGVCGIARPESFAAMVQAAGCGLLDTLTFRDHHHYEMSDVEQIIETARRLQASGFVTTEKDAVKLTSTMREKLETVGPVVVVRLEVEFGDPEGVVRQIEGRIA